MLLAGGTFVPAEISLTQEQKREALIPAGYHKAELAKRTDIPADRAAMTAEFAQYLAGRTMNLKRPPLVDEFGQDLPR